ncbi:MAG: serine hydrolase [Anaerolineae bacterium]
MLADVAARYDSPPTEAQPALDSLSFRAGEPGYTLDIEASRARIDEALFEPLERSVELVIDEQAQPQADIDSLGDLLIDYVDASGFTGVASVFVVDLQTGDELELNIDTRDGGTPSLITCDIAYASMSTMKIPIMVDYFRHLERLPERDPQRDDAYKLLIETMTLSGNISANFMMQSSGFGDLERGVENVTQTAQYLGLENTFIVAGYDVEDPPEYYSTPAREAARDGSCVNTRPDAYMQTTIRDMALLLDMIYQCSEFGGGLTAAYPDAITQADCQMMLETMADNEEGVLILAGVPQDIDVAHKHGWISDTHGDAGVVFTPGGDYVLVMTLWADVAWLNFQESFPVLQDISAAVFNYFNPDRINDPRRGLSPLETGEELPPPPPPSDDEGDTS